MDMAELLKGAQTAVTFAQTVPPIDPRITLALSLVASTLTVVQGVHATGIFDPHAPLAVETLGLSLTENLRQQLLTLGMPPTT